MIGNRRGREDKRKEEMKEILKRRRGVKKGKLVLIGRMPGMKKKIKKRKKGKVITEEVYVIKTRGKGKRCRRRERGKCEEGKEKEWLRKMRRESSN